MYEELIKRLKDYSTARKGEIAELTEDAADAIEELQAAVSGYEATTDVEFVKEDGHERILFVPKWIHVTERLPYPGDKVIVAIRDESGDSRYDYTNTGWWSGDGYKFVVEDEFCLWVTHWMPLPTPPKEETE